MQKYDVSAKNLNFLTYKYKNLNKVNSIQGIVMILQETFTIIYSYIQ